jgi:hypothetical protein
MFDAAALIVGFCNLLHSVEPPTIPTACSMLQPRNSPCLVLTLRHLMLLTPGTPRWCLADLAPSPDLGGTVSTGGGSSADSRCRQERLNAVILDQVAVLVPGRSPGHGPNSNHLITYVADSDSYLFRCTHPETGKTART